ncbi:hypothetical protein AURDEDRAFT_130411 [Auricularia subglabra TFB-10046 SS5]|uniref:Uncharacterized protein n=1 Tax=Auricularia subglabra (strain TFB-10046 / SS5) TaxID=717982 RepID=J0D8M9_AURST|nr:hypothetical protein AURDEDRAFT_130411 [Auricularia subglabra TFB-10046 SS5]
MYHFTLSSRLELSPSRAVDRNGEQRYLSFASLPLDDGTVLDFAVTKTFDKTGHSDIPLHARRTCAQVRGDADLIGSTMFVANASIIESDGPELERAEPCSPTVVFTGVVSWSGHSAFHALINAGGSWPPQVQARCLYDASSPHFRKSFAVPVPDDARVTVSGVLTGLRDDRALITVHDIRTDGSQPCPGHCSKNVPELANDAGEKFCQWIAHREREQALLDENEWQETYLRTVRSSPKSPAYASVSLCYSPTTPQFSPHGSPAPLALAKDTAYRRSSSEFQADQQMPTESPLPPKPLRLPPSPGPHSRAYWKWYDLRISSASF